jgi:CDGSH-type Zn-finger protein
MIAVSALDRHRDHISGTHVLAVLTAGGRLLPTELRLCKHQRLVLDPVGQAEPGQIALSTRRDAGRRHNLPGSEGPYDGRVSCRAPGKQAPVDDFVTAECSAEPSTADTASQRSAADAVVTLYENGPLILRGRFILTAQDGNLIPAGRRTVALCRCGASTLKPFCDGSHARIRFRAPGRAQGSRTAAEPPDGGGGAGQSLAPIADAAAQPAAHSKPAAD